MICQTSEGSLQRPGGLCETAMDCRCFRQIFPKTAKTMDGRHMTVYKAKLEDLFYIESKLGNIQMFGDIKRFTAIWNQHAFCRGQLVCYTRQLENGTEQIFVLAIVTNVGQNGSRWFKVKNADSIPSWGHRIFDFTTTDMMKSSDIMFEASMGDCRNQMIYPYEGNFNDGVLPNNAKKIPWYQEDSRILARIQMEMTQCVTCLDTGLITDVPCTWEQGDRITQSQVMQSGPRHTWQEEIDTLNPLDISEDVQEVLQELIEREDGTINFISWLADTARELKTDHIHQLQALAQTAEGQRAKTTPDLDYHCVLPVNTWSKAHCQVSFPVFKEVGRKLPVYSPPRYETRFNGAMAEFFYNRTLHMVQTMLSMSGARSQFPFQQHTPEQLIERLEYESARTNEEHQIPMSKQIDTMFYLHVMLLGIEGIKKMRAIYSEKETYKFAIFMGSVQMQALLIHLTETCNRAAHDYSSHVIYRDDFGEHEKDGKPISGPDAVNSSLGPEHSVQQVYHVGQPKRMFGERRSEDGKIIYGFQQNSQDIKTMAEIIHNECFVSDNSPASIANEIYEFSRRLSDQGWITGNKPYDYMFGEIENGARLITYQTTLHHGLMSKIFNKSQPETHGYRMRNNGVIFLNLSEIPNYVLLNGVYVYIPNALEDLMR